MDNKSLEDILKETEDSFIFSKTHQYHNVDLFAAVIFNLQIWLETNKDNLRDINIFQIIIKWLNNLQQNKTIDSYDNVNNEQCFYIYPTHKQYDTKSYEYKLSLPLYKDDIA